MRQSILSVMMVTVLLSACTTPGKRTGIGAGAGGAAGAGLGAIIGHNTGMGTGEGAAIGAGLGALIGSVVGNRFDKQAKELEQVAETRRTNNGIITKLQNDILFDTGSASLRPAAQNSIAQITEIIKKYPEDRITVVGYTDDVGDAAYNQRLSERRAEAVKKEMITDGVPGSTILILGKGESSPVVPNTSNANRQLNRRVELHITAEG